MVLDNNDVPKPYSSSPKVHAEMALAFGDSYPAAQNTGAQRVHLDADGRGCPMSPGEARILRHRREIAVRAVRWGWGLERSGGAAGPRLLRESHKGPMAACVWRWRTRVAQETPPGLQSGSSIGCTGPGPGRSHGNTTVQHEEDIILHQDALEGELSAAEHCSAAQGHCAAALAKVAGHFFGCCNSRVAEIRHRMEGHEPSMHPRSDYAMVPRHVDDAITLHSIPEVELRVTPL